MGYADTVTKEYMRNNAVFADAFNYLIYDGAQVITPEQLHELDTTEIAIPFSTENVKNDKHNAVQDYRDILKSAVVMQDDSMAYIILGIENQTDVHYAMPVRNMIYDALQYGRQVSDIAAGHRKNRKQKNSEASEAPKVSEVTAKKHSNAEYLSGFCKDDRITPVITLVIHFGADKWDGPLSLHDMMELDDPRLMRFVQDHHVHLIEPVAMTEDDLLKFTTSLREVMGFIKYSKDKNKLRSFIHDDQRMLIEVNAAHVIQAVTNTKFKVDDDSGVINVCKAIEDMMADERLAGIAEGRASGIAEGKAFGIAEGKAFGIAEGKAFGITEGKVYALAGLVRDGIISLDEAARRADMSPADFEAAAKKSTI